MNILSYPFRFLLLKLLNKEMIISFLFLFPNRVHEPYESDSQMLYKKVNNFSRETLLPLSQLTFMFL